jgi:hypothetical protein
MIVQILYKIVIGLLVILALVSIISRIVFNQKVKKELDILTENLIFEEEVIFNDDLSHLLNPVQRWLTYSGVINKNDIKYVELHQDIKMRLGNDKPWMNASANQYITTDEPGFICHVDINMAPLVHISDRDKYINGRGEMLIKLMSLIKIADSRGDEIDQGTLLRYLAEICWVPTAALKDYIYWESIDEHHAKSCDDL